MKWRIPKDEITFYTTWRPGLHNRFPDRMLMCGKVTNKNLIGSSRYSELKSIMEMCITGYSAMENPIHITWKSKDSFPTFCKQGFPQLHRAASYTHSHNADYCEMPLVFLSFSPKNL